MLPPFKEGASQANFSLQRPISIHSRYIPQTFGVDTSVKFYLRWTVSERDRRGKNRKKERSWDVDSGRNSASGTQKSFACDGSTPITKAKFL
ncbi:hypothetical protein TNIN_93461 [Trichonephila inaurata madagascariensis]|uniref:Uncharacterized protein n=1 Tax=Trichonephila inaurata madagascariensis TaxID=2747483 RepID=A0A8X7C738_9ARAC|nr:hypothetical protein TNIN_93461 [Trichonephila inaurata madagascariensis]